MEATSQAGPSIKHATVLFLDLKGFTALSGEVGPEAAYFAVGGCMRLIEDVARSHGAAVDRYLGDCLMAVFGHPVPLPDAPRAALSAALEMRELAEDYNRGLSFEVPLEVVIGINTGPMVAGDVRGKVVREFHVLGDAVNTSARIKARAPLGAILVGGATRAPSGDDFEFESLGEIPLKGKSAPVAIYELKGSRESHWRHAVGPRGGLDAPFVGRDAERALLGGLVAGLSDGRGASVALVGEAGIGKSRLLGEVVAEHPAVAVLEVRAASATRAGERPTLAYLGAALGLPEDTPLEQSLDALERRAAAGPALLALEDAGRLDAASVAALPRLLELTRRLPLLVVALVRTPVRGPLTGALEAAVASGSMRELRLEPLAAAEARALLEAVQKVSDVPIASSALIEARAAGNPRQLVLAAHLEPALRAEHARGERGASSDTERRRSTILFADITGFTAMTERLGAERAYPIVAGCLELLDDIARRHGGTVEKHLGDCVMALFGVAEAMEDAPRAAVNAAIEMRRRVREYNEGVDAPVDLDVHSGINVGLGIAGDVAGSLLRELTVMGDPVDVADALKDLAPSGRIFVGGEVQRFTRDVFDFEPREPLRLKGGGEEVPVFEVTTEREHLHRSRVGSERQVYSALVGREAEFDVLRKRLAELKEGRGGVVNIAAEAGLGKTRLIAELEKSPEAEGARWLLGRSLSTGRHLGFHPFADLLRAFSGAEDRDDDAAVRAKLMRAMRRWMGEDAEERLPFVARVLGVPLEAADQQRLDALPRDTLEKLVVRHLTALLLSGSEVEPVVVVMDDLHWADQSSLELLERLIPECRERPLLLIHLFRPGFGPTAERLRSAGAEGLFTEIALRPLEPRAARDLLANLFGPGDLPHATRQLIEEKARGNPFYIEEVVRALVDEGAVEAHAGRFRATDRIATVEIPGSVQEVVQARVDGLDRPRRRLLQMAAVVGQNFHLDVLSQVAGGEDGAAVGELVERLRAAEFLVPSDRLPGEEYAFKHPLIQEVTYDGLLEARREELHRRVGEAVEAKLDEDMPGYEGMLAYHYSKGRDLARAETHLLRAGEDAARAAASNEALHFFEEAAALFLELHGEGGDPEKRALLEANIASALYHRGRFVDSVAHYDAALELLGDKVAREERAQKLGFAWDLVRVLGRLYVPLRLRRAPPAGERERRIMGLRYARAESTTYASSDRHVFDGMRTLALVQRLDAHTVPESAKMYAGAVALFALGGVSFGVSRRLARVAAELAEGAAPPEQLYERAMNFAYRVLEGDWSPEQEIDPELVEETIRLGHLWAPVTYLGLLAEKRLYQGDFADTGRVLERLEAIWDVYQYDLAKTNLFYIRALEALERGRFEEARQRAVAYYEENPEDLLHLLALGIRARSEILLGDLDAAEEALREGAEIAARSKPVPPFHASRFLGSRLRLAIARLEETREGGGHADRRARASARRDLRAVLSNAPRLAFVRVEMLRMAGRLEWLQGHYRRSLDHYARSLAAADHLGAKLAGARTWAQLAELLGASGEGPQAFRGLDATACQAEALRGVQELAVDVSPGGLLRC